MITIKIDDRELRRRLTGIAKKQMPFAASRALNATGYDILEENKNLMRNVFDNPTPWTLNAFMVKRATKNHLTVSVERKTAVGRRFYLDVQKAGGARKQTGIESLFEHNLPFAGQINAVIPTRNIRRNKYGNVSPAAMQRILSGVKVQRDKMQNSTRASAKRSRGRRAFYFAPKAGSRLSPGVWERRGRRIRKVLAFTKVMPKYTAKFPMEKHARGVAVRVFAPHFKRELHRAVQTAR